MNWCAASSLTEIGLCVYINSTFLPLLLRYNGHPEFKDLQPNLQVENVVIIGQGNVAIDCARVLCKTMHELEATDISSKALESLSSSKIKNVYILGRRGHIQAAFTM